MNRTSQCVLTVLTLTACRSGSPPPDDGAGDIDTEGIRAHVEFLADDLLEGRGTGARGHEIAVRYVAGVFRAAGLEPGGTLACAVAAGVG